ncbi:unnamed protein product, partial [Staurois parvus]
MLKLTVRRSRQLSTKSIAKVLQTFRLAYQQCVESFMEWVSMAEQLHPSFTSPKYNAKHRMQWCKARRHWTL